MSGNIILRERGFGRIHVPCFCAGKKFTALLFVVAFCTAATISFAQTAWISGCRPNYSVFQSGEQLTYEVSYLGIGLGTITSKIISVDTTREGIRISAEGLIRTYRGVPFVTLNTLFRTLIGDSLSSTAFRNKEYISEEKAFKYIEYVYKPRFDVVYINEYIEGRQGTEKRDTLDLEGKKWQDGLSLLFYARAFAHAKCSHNVPVLMYRSKAMTTIHFGRGKEAVKVDAAKYRIGTNKLDGETGFTGIFGLTGGFEGWFSDDSAAVPITAKMHVLIGSVRIKLIQWQRPGWKPPRSDL